VIYCFFDLIIDDLVKYEGNFFCVSLINFFILMFNIFLFVINLMLFFLM